MANKLNLGSFDYIIVIIDYDFMWLKIITNDNQKDVEHFHDMFVGLTLLHLACVFDQADVLAYFLR